MERHLHVLALEQALEINISQRPKFGQRW